MNKDNILKFLLSTFGVNSNNSIFERPLKINSIKNITVSDNEKDELEKYIKNVFQYAKTLPTENNYKYSYIFDYKTYRFIINYPCNYTLTDLLKAYVILSDAYNNTSWTNFCCNNTTGDFNIYCNNCDDCKNCIKCNDCDNCNDCDHCNMCDNCNDCKFSNHLSDCLRCDNCNDCITCNYCDDCNYCTCINNKNKCYEINN